MEEVSPRLEIQPDETLSVEEEAQLEHSGEQPPRLLIENQPDFSEPVTVKSLTLAMKGHPSGLPQVSIYSQEGIAPLLVTLTQIDRQYDPFDPAWKHTACEVCGEISDFEAHILSFDHLRTCLSKGAPYPMEYSQLERHLADDRRQVFIVRHRKKKAFFGICVACREEIATHNGDTALVTILETQHSQCSISLSDSQKLVRRDQIESPHPVGLLPVTTTHRKKASDDKFAPVVSFDYIQHCLLKGLPLPPRVVRICHSQRLFAYYKAPSTSALVSPQHGSGLIAATDDIVVICAACGRQPQFSTLERLEHDFSLHHAQCRIIAEASEDGKYFAMIPASMFSGSNTQRGGNSA